MYFHYKYMIYVLQPPLLIFQVLNNITGAHFTFKYAKYNKVLQTLG